MTAYNICLVQPPGYIHSFAFLELAELLFHSLRELGCQAKLAVNRLEPDARNIVIGCHLLDTAAMAAFPPDTIIVNTEQLANSQKDWGAIMLQWNRAGFEIWDYSDRNIEIFNTLGFGTVRKLGLGFQRELVRIVPAEDQDVDVLFYGGINQRRHEILEALGQRGLKVQRLFGVYAQERDRWIARSKVVLNLHGCMAEIFEVVRVFYLLTNSVVVVGEVNPTTAIEPHFREGIIGCAYDQLVEQTMLAVADPARRAAQAARAQAAMARHPQREFTQALLG